MVVGTGETSRIVRRQLEEDPESGVNITCIFTYKDAESGSLLDGIPVVANLDQFSDHLNRYKIKRVILADSLMPMSVRERIRSYCQTAEIDVQDFSGFLRYDNSGLPFIVERALNLKIYAQKARFGRKTDHILQGNVLFNYLIAA